MISANKVVDIVDTKNDILCPIIPLRSPTGEIFFVKKNIDSELYQVMELKLEFTRHNFWRNTTRCIYSSMQEIKLI